MLQISCGGGSAASRSRTKSTALSNDCPMSSVSSKTMIPRRSIGPPYSRSPSVSSSRPAPSLVRPHQRSSRLSISLVTKARSSRRASEEEPYPFDEREFVRVIPAVVARSSRDPARGVVVFAQITEADADEGKNVSEIGVRGDGATLHDGAMALSMEIGGDGLLALLLMGAKSAAQSERRERRAEARKRELERRQRRTAERKIGFGGFFAASQQREEEEEEEEDSSGLDSDSDDGEDNESEGGEGPGPVPPLALDLLWKVLSRGRRLSKREWSLVRVAVVDVDARSGAFAARLFFGGKGLSSASSSSSSASSTQQPVVTWETRARPSEAAWLAHRFDAPLFVRKDIFLDRCSPLGELLKEVDAALDAMGASSDDEAGELDSDADDSDYEFVEDDDDDDDGDEDEEDNFDSDDGGGERRRRGRHRKRKSSSAPVPFSSIASKTPLPALAILAPGDPPPVVLLKRQLAVAISEEDYSSASAIRDHPLMAAYSRAEEAEAKGDAPAAAAAAADLARLLRAGEERDAAAAAKGRQEEAAAGKEEEEEEEEKEEEEEQKGAAECEEAGGKKKPRASSSSPRAASSSSSPSSSSSSAAAAAASAAAAAGRGGSRGGRTSSTRGGRGGRGSAAAERPPSPPPPGDEEGDPNI